MDLYCPVDAEPWDNDSIHDEVDYRRENGIEADYRSVLREFQSKGCEALTLYASGPCRPATGIQARNALLASAMYDLMGDDADGAMSMMEDSGYF